MKKIILYISFLSVINVGLSCSYRQQQAMFENDNTANVIPQNKGADLTGYQIKAQDILQIRNLQNRKYIVDEPVTTTSATSVNNNSEGQTYTVEEDSTVTLPIIGHVKVAGLTRLQAARFIETLYRKELKDPIIELKIVNLKVTLLGEVTNQGTYPLVKDRTSLIDIIGDGGGLTERANSKNVKIIRGAPDQQQVIKVDLSNINTLSNPEIILRNNDVIYITQNKRTIRSEKLQSFSSVIQPVVVLLNTALIIYTLTR